MSRPPLVTGEPSSNIPNTVAAVPKFTSVGVPPEVPEPESVAARTTTSRLAGRVTLFTVFAELIAKE